MDGNIRYVSDMSGGNWYRVWAIHTIEVTGTDGKQRVAVQPHVVISDDDKVKSFTVQCTSDIEADVKAKQIAMQLKQNLFPLAAVVGVSPSELPDDIRAYDEKRMQHYQRTPSLT